ncbi:MAG: hypothetical protein ACRD21_13955, partial [Vicinamibacteria bacterium]
ARVLVFLLLGLGVPLVSVGAYFAFEGTLSEAYQAIFVIPSRVANDYYGRNAARFLESLQWFARWSSPLLGLAAVAFASGRAMRDPVSRGALAWLLSGAGVTFMQMGWPYHFMLLVWPLGIVAAAGLDVLLTHLKPLWAGKSSLLRSVALILVLSTFFFPAVLNLAGKVRHLLPPLSSPTARSWIDYRARVQPWYAQVLADVAFLPKTTSPRFDLYVFGDPLYLYLSGRIQPVPINGWSPEFLLPDQWIVLEKDLEGAEPSYVFVQDYNDELIRQRCPAVLNWLENRYSVIKKSERGTWYQRIARRALLGFQSKQ